MKYVIINVENDFCIILRLLDNSISREDTEMDDQTLLRFLTRIINYNNDVSEALTELLGILKLHKAQQNQLEIVTDLISCHTFAKEGLTHKNITLNDISIAKRKHQLANETQYERFEREVMEKVMQ